MADEIVKQEAQPIVPPQPTAQEEMQALAQMSPKIAQLYAQAKVLLKAGLLPAHFNTVAKVISVGLAADEMGIGTQQAARSMYVIDGKVGMQTNLLLGMAYKKVPGFWLKLIESTEKTCTITMGRQGGSEATVTFTEADALKAGLLAPPKSGRPGAWQKYKADMLINRTLSKGLRIIAPDATMGLYTDEEVQSVAAPETTPLTADAITITAETKEEENGQG